MGGYGSGRPAERVTTEECLSLNINLLRRAGYLEPFVCGGWQWTGGGERIAWIRLRAEPGRLVLLFRCDAEDFEQPVAIVWTRCHFGGSRPWFSCSRCTRRCAKLYVPAGARYFLCRHCYGLGYESRREQPHYRALRRARKLWARLGDPDGDFVPFKPKGMHWNTYLRLVDQAEAAEAAADGHFAAHMVRRHARLAASGA